MGATDQEVPLGGGRVTPGVARVGKTVRRPPGAHSEFVGRLLAHLSRRGFEGAPRALGIDGEGRDIFSFVEGDVPADLGRHDDATLVQAAALLRRFHDLGAELVDTPSARAAGIEVVCHNDLSPCNFVFRGGAPVAIIDFDACAPGARVHDLGYAAWLWLDIGNAEISPVEQTRRLTLFLEAYGEVVRRDLLNAIQARQAILAFERPGRGDPDRVRWVRGCLAWTQVNLVVLACGGL